MASASLPCSLRLLGTSLLVLVAVLLLSFYRHGRQHAPSPVTADFRQFLDSHAAINNDDLARYFSAAPPTTLAGSLLFFKTHKTGSSTVTTVLWRQLCLLRGKNCFLPPKSNPGRIWDFTRNDHRQYAHSTPGTASRGMPFDAFLHHVKNHPFLASSLLQQPTSKVSIVRRPSLRFQSAFHWYRLQESLGLHDFADFLDQLGSLEDEAAVYQHLLGLQTKWKYRTGLNTMSEELTGYRVTDVHFLKAFQDLVQDILAFRVQLLVSDRFDESILVLQQLLRLQPLHTTTASGNTGISSENVDFSTIYYLPQKVQAYEDLSRNTTYAAFFQLLDRVQSFDDLIYRLANVALDLSIRTYGQQKFASDLEQYRGQLKEVRSFCQQQLAGGDDLESRPDSRRSSTASTSSGLLLSKELCSELSKDNKDLIADFWSKTQH